MWTNNTTQYIYSICLLLGTVVAIHPQFLVWMKRKAGKKGIQCSFKTKWKCFITGGRQDGWPRFQSWRWSDPRLYCENSLLKSADVILCVRERSAEFLLVVEDPRYGMRDGKERRVPGMLELDSDRRMWVTNWMKQGFFSSRYRSFHAQWFQLRPAVVGQF